MSKVSVKVKQKAPRKSILKKGKKASREQIELEGQVRTIRFAKKSVENKLTLFFYVVLACLLFFLIMLFGRLDTIARASHAQSIDEKQVVSEIQKSLETQDMMLYQGNQFVQTLVSRTEGTDGQKEWEEAITPFLAKKFPLDQLGFSPGERRVNNVIFIQQETLDKKAKTFQLTYEVTYTEDKEEQSLPLTFPVSYQKGQLKVIGIPRIAQLEEIETKNEATYDETLQKVTGESVSQEEKEAITSFVTNYFDLYVTNDEKLKLISAVQGLSNATLVSQTIDSIIEQDTDTVLVTGSYQIKFGESSTIGSPYQLKLSKMNNTYFVDEMN